MDQLHKRFTTDQIKALLKGYCQGTLDRLELQEILEINKTRLFALLKQYRRDPDNFSLSYHRTSPARLNASVEEEMAKELASDKQLIEDPSLSINTYNYSAIRDRLIKREITVSLSTIINRAKDLDCYQSRPRKMAHDREVVTTAIGTLINTMPPAIAGRLTPKKSGFLSLPWMISAGNSSMPISLNRKQPGLTSKRLRL